MNARANAAGGTGIRCSDLAKRYARAAYDFAAETKSEGQTIADLRALAESFAKDTAIEAFFASPVIKPEAKEAAIKAALSTSKTSEAGAQLLLTLAKKKRLPLFSQVVQAFENRIDDVNGVCRGLVRSATVLAPKERSELEAIIEKVLNKKVILTYTTDPSVIGGLVAQVGSFTFDDSIESHLKRMTHELNAGERA